MRSSWARIGAATALAGLLTSGGVVAGSIGSLTDVSEADAGLASGLNNSSFQIGGALGVAIVSSVAVSEAAGANPLIAATNGFQSAFAGAIIFAAVGLLVASALLGRLRAGVPVPAT